MALINNAPPPLGDAIAQPVRPEFKDGNDPKAGLCGQAWGDWFTNVMANQEKSPGRLAAVVLRDQSADIAATPISTTPLSAGLYQIKFYLRLSRVDSLNASVILTFHFTWNGAVRTITSGTLGANTLAQTIGNPLPLIAIDANSQITYETITVFGTGDGRYAIDILLYELNA